MLADAAFAFTIPPLFASMYVTPSEEALNRQISPMDADLHTYGFPAGYFVIRSMSNDRLLDVANDEVEDSTEVILWPRTETSLVESMRKPESNNQVFFIDTSGALCSRSSGHAIDVEDERLVLRHRRPVSHPFPNAYSHPLPRFSYDPMTKEITLTFACDPTYPSSPQSHQAIVLSTWKDNTYLLSAIPMRKPRTILDDAAALLTTAFTPAFSVFSALGSPTKATPDDVFNTGDVDLREDEILEQDRTDEGEVDDSLERIRRVRVVAFAKEQVGSVSEQAKSRRRWEVIPLRSTKRSMGGI